MSLLLAGTIARAGALAEGWIEISGERIADAQSGKPPREPDERCAGVLAPGLCDLEVNGAGGHDVAAGGAGIAAIGAIQLAHGVTSYLPTLLSPDDGTARRVLAELAEHAADPASPVVGVHVEGPFISPEFAGMHPPQRLRAPAAGVPSWLCAPPVRLVTLAPELPGALELIQRLTGNGIAVALGHSAADERAASAAIDAGATLVTHVFNAMAALHHRAPGLAGRALVDERVHVSVIADGIHVDALALELVRRAAGARTVLISDASPAAVAPPGRYVMAGVAIETAPDAAGPRTSDGRLAGSAITLDQGLAAWIALARASLAEAVLAASEAPAAAIGLPAALEPGALADLVVLGDGGRVERVMRRGRWLVGGI